MKIDSHHHFWKYDASEYDWIDDSMQRLRRDFLPADLQQEIDFVEVNGVVSVQARQSLTETQWLLDFCADNSFILGVVGWVELCSETVRQQLEKYSSHPKLKAVRHVVQDEPDDEFILRDDFNRGIAQLKDHGMVYDILIFEHQLAPTIQFVDRHAEQLFVLDHVAKPQIGNSLLQPWRTHIRELAKRPNVYCKVSGMVTEANHENWTHEQLLPYWETVLEAFGPQRLMFGSDWPVCLLACEYAHWHQTVKTFASELSSSEQDALFGATAIEAYGLNSPEN